MFQWIFSFKLMLVFSRIMTHHILIFFLNFMTLSCLGWYHVFWPKNLWPTDIWPTDISPTQCLVLWPLVGWSTSLLSFAWVDQTSVDQMIFDEKKWNPFCWMLILLVPRHSTKWPSAQGTQHYVINHTRMVLSWSVSLMLAVLMLTVLVVSIITLSDVTLIEAFMLRVFMPY